jgi:uncharacterized Zn ribbon protein
MKTKSCENCHKAMTYQRSTAPFYCRACSDEWFAAERKQAVEWFRASGIFVKRNDEAAA